MALFAYEPLHLALLTLLTIWLLFLAGGVLLHRHLLHRPFVFLAYLVALILCVLGLCLLFLA